MHALHHTGLRQGGRDVVPVSDVGDRAPGQRPEPLSQGQHVGDGLAGMLLVGQRVDDAKGRRGGGEILQHLLRERTNDDGIHPAFQVLGHVLRGLATAKRHFRRHQDRLASQLADRDLEGHARAQRRLVEEQRHVPALERCLEAAAAGRPRLLEPRGQREAGIQLARREVREREKRARPGAGALRRRGPRRRRDRLHLDVAACRGRSSHVRYSPLMRTYSALRSHVQTTAAPLPPAPRSTCTSISGCFRYSAAAGA